MSTNTLKTIKFRLLISIWTTKSMSLINLYIHCRKIAVDLDKPNFYIHCRVWCKIAKIFANLKNKCYYCNIRKTVINGPLTMFYENILP